MQYLVVNRPNPLNKDEKKFYCTPSYGEKITIRDLCEELSDATTINSSDIHAVLDGFAKAVAKYTSRGNVVYLGDWGHFRVTFRSKGQDNIQDVSALDIINPRVTFRGSSYFKQMVNNHLTFSPYVPKNTIRPEGGKTPDNNTQVDDGNDPGSTF